MKEFKTTQRKAVHTDLVEYCLMANKGDIIEVTEWANGEGYDVSICTGSNVNNFYITYGQYKALKAIIKEMNK
jgi:hypothetical protein